MKHGTLVLPAERARYFVDLIGQKVQIQIRDMNQHSMKRHYRKYIQRYGFHFTCTESLSRIEEIERSLRFILEEISRSGVKGVMDNVC
jgi:V-type H+-transporting ATPase subunit a